VNSDIGRTHADFQCPSRVINRLLPTEVRSERANRAEPDVLKQNSQETEMKIAKQKGRRKAGLF